MQRSYHRSIIELKDGQIIKDQIRNLKIFLDISDSDVKNKELLVLLGFVLVIFFKSSYAIKSVLQNYSAKNFVFSKGLVSNRYFETFRNILTMTFDEFNLLK
ncbi:hypothetical protein OC709_01730 ['Planchonia careya' phytoplasma]|nr:hypothetical protein ['Planchonia careya' phytoplasma]MDO8030230.1 hypothetical protein ['Planchonia careya' phytoplasma]